jgi:hypothetical protein
MQAKYPPSAYSGARARLPDWLAGVPCAAYLERAVGLLALRDGDSVCDIACGPGCNICRLVRAVGSSRLVTAVEDNPHRLSRAQRKVEQAGWGNVQLLDSLDPEQIPRAPADGIIIGYNPPIVLQRPGLPEAAWAILKPGGRLSAVGARCTTPAGRLAGPLLKLGLGFLGHPRDWHHGTVREPGSTSQSSHRARCRSSPSWALRTSSGPGKPSTPTAPQQQTGGHSAEALAHRTPRSRRDNGRTARTSMPRRAAGLAVTSAGDRRQDPLLATNVACVPGAGYPALL